MKKLYEKFASDKRFVMIGLSLDYTAGDLETFVDQNEIRWPQSHLGRWSKTPVPSAWGVRGIPALFLIDPDGKMAAIDLTAESATSELERRLFNQ